MNEMKRRSVVLIIIAIATLTLVVGMATFAFFATGRDLENGVVNANVGTAASMYQFSATSNGNIEMEITFNDMSQANVSEEKIKTGNATIDVSLASPSDDMLTMCTYDIVWIWDSQDKYTMPDAELPYVSPEDKKDLLHGISDEQFAQMVASMFPDENGNPDYEAFYDFYKSMGIPLTIYNYEFSAQVDNNKEKDLSKLALNDNKVVLQKGASISATSKEAVNKTHVINASIYNLPIDQTNLFNKKFSAHVTIENLNCDMTSISDETLAKSPTLTTYLTNDVYNSEDNKLNIGNGSSGLYFHDSNLANSANDNTYRYAGADSEVNNYVCFAKEGCGEENLYRVISVDNKVKVIKATSIGNMEWNNAITVADGYTAGTTLTAEEEAQNLTAGKAYANIWAIKKADGSYYTATLNTYLNNEYYNSLSFKEDIDDTIWSVAGVDYNVISTANAKGFMDIELNNAATYTSKVGLMYVSDYMFAAKPEYWTKVGYNEDDEAADYRTSLGNDWLLTKGFPWTISRYSGNPDDAFIPVSFDGSLNGNFVIYPLAVHPSFSLKFSIKIINAATEGVGSKEKPMILY